MTAARKAAAIDCTVDDVETKTTPFREPRPDALLCYCMHVTERTIAETIAAGAHDLESLMASTRAGRGCGTCRFDLLERLATQCPERCPRRCPERCDDR